MRSITDPETIEAAVQENSRKAAQNTPVMRSERLVAMVGELAALAEPSTSPPLIQGPFGNAQ